MSNPFIRVQCLEHNFTSTKTFYGLGKVRDPHLDFHSRLDKRASKGYLRRRGMRRSRGLGLPHRQTIPSTILLRTRQSARPSPTGRMLRRTPSPHTGQSYNRALLGTPTIPWRRTKKEKRGKNYALHRLAEKVDRV